MSKEQISRILQITVEAAFDFPIGFSSKLIIARHQWLAIYLSILGELVEHNEWKEQVIKDCQSLCECLDESYYNSLACTNVILRYND